MTKKNKHQLFLVHIYILSKVSIPSSSTTRWNKRAWHMVIHICFFFFFLFSFWELIISVLISVNSKVRSVKMWNSCTMNAVTVKVKVKVKKIEAPSAPWGGGGREREWEAQNCKRQNAPFWSRKTQLTRSLYGLLFKPVAQNETVTTMSHSQPMGARQHNWLYCPGFLTTTLVSTIPFPLTLTTCLLFLSLSLSLCLCVRLCSHSYFSCPCIHRKRFIIYITKITKIESCKYCTKNTKYTPSSLPRYAFLFISLKWTLFRVSCKIFFCFCFLSFFHWLEKRKNWGWEKEKVYTNWNGER